MFLGVSGSLLDVEMTTQDRAKLAARLQREQAARFGGIAKRAYTAAGVNSASWTRVVNGETVKPHIQHKIVATLWPETEGDWTRIPDPGSSMERLRELASQPPRGEVDRIMARLDAIERRLSNVEHQLPAGPHLSAVAKTGEVETHTDFEDMP
jgi:hypothetical protein